VDDEILAIDDHRVLPQHWETRLAHYRPGEQATVLVARRERLQRLSITFGAEPPKRWQLEVHPDATAEQRARLAAWLATSGSLSA
jgi:predicted metalloprotease with PDZ domain